jgi:hypothetical protein
VQGTQPGAYLIKMSQIHTAATRQERTVSVEDDGALDADDDESKPFSMLVDTQLHAP